MTSHLREITSLEGYVYRHINTEYLLPLPPKSILNLFFWIVKTQTFHPSPETKIFVMTSSNMFAVKRLFCYFFSDSIIHKTFLFSFFESCPSQDFVSLCWPHKFIWHTLYISNFCFTFHGSKILDTFFRTFCWTFFFVRKEERKRKIYFHFLILSVLASCSINQYRFLLKIVFWSSKKTFAPSSKKRRAEYLNFQYRIIIQQQQQKQQHQQPLRHFSTTPHICKEGLFD